MKNKYSHIINDYVDIMKEKFADELEMILIIGSSSSNKVMENWSDIDSILVIKEFDFNIIEKIKKITNNFSVKIGTTIYSKKEFETKKIDPKTYYHLYLYQKKEIDLHFKSNSLIIPNISFDEVHNNYTQYLNENIHVYKRMFLYDNLDKKQIRTLYKTTYLLMKAILIINGYIPKNYDDVFKLYSKNFNIEYYDYEDFIKKYLNDDIKYTNIIEYAKKFLISIVD